MRCLVKFLNCSMLFVLCEGILFLVTLVCSLLFLLSIHDENIIAAVTVLYYVTFLCFLIIVIVIVYISRSLL